MMYKIGLLGTHGTGKTTLTHDLAKQLKKRNYTVRVIGEIATVAKKRGFPTDQNTTLEAQGWILLNQCAAELEAEMHGYKIAICDRTVYDNNAYLRRGVGDNIHYTRLMQGHAQTHPYQGLYYLPLTTFELNGKKRDSDPEFQQQIDRLISSYIEDYLPQCLMLPKDKTPEDWADIIFQKTMKDL